MERLTKRNLHDFAIPTQGTDAFHLFQTVDRLAAIEDILGDEYDLGRLRELAQADREGRCVVFVSGYPVVSIYRKAEDGLCIREVSGVITEEEYKAALRREQDG